MADTFAVLPLLRRWWWALLLGAVLAGGVAYVVSSHQKPTYKGEAKFIVGPINANADDLAASGSLARTYAELAVDRPVLRDAIARAGSDCTLVKELQKRLNASANDVSRILTITVLDDNSRVAANLANAIGARLQQLSKADADQNATRITQFADSGPVASLSGRERAQVVIAAKQLLGQTAAGRISVVQSAEPGRPRGPRHPVHRGHRDAGWCGARCHRRPLPGVLHAGHRERGRAGGAVGREAIGTRGCSTRSQLAQVAACLDLPSGTPEAEQYRLLAFKLGYLESDDSPGSLVLLDPKQGNTSGIVTGNLAAAISQAGWRVLVVDANTAGEGLTGMFRLDGSRGYTDLLGSSTTASWTATSIGWRWGPATRCTCFPAEAREAPWTPTWTASGGCSCASRRSPTSCLVSAPPPHRAPLGLMWARVADRTLLVLDEGRTSRDEAKNTLQSLAVADANVIGTTLAQRRPLAELVGRLWGAFEHPTPPGGPRRRATSPDRLARSATGLGRGRTPKPARRGGRP